MSLPQRYDRAERLLKERITASISFTHDANHELVANGLANVVDKGVRKRLGEKGQRVLQGINALLDVFRQITSVR